MALTNAEIFLYRESQESRFNLSNDILFFNPQLWCSLFDTVLCHSNNSLEMIEAMWQRVNTCPAILPWICQSTQLDAIMDNQNSKFKEVVDALVTAWELMISYLVDTGVPQKDLIHWIQKHTVNVVMRGEWAATTQSARLHLKQQAARAAQLLRDRMAEQKHSDSTDEVSTREVVAMFSSLNDLITDPWGSPLLKDILNGQQKKITGAVLELFRVEMGQILRMRLKGLINSKCEDMALNLAEMYIKCFRDKRWKARDEFAVKDTDFTVITYTNLLYKFKREDDIISYLKGLSADEGLYFIKIHLQNDDESRIARHSRRVASVGAQYFLGVALIKPFCITCPEYLDKLISLWVEINQVDSSATINLPSMVRKMVTFSDSTKNVYKLSAILMERFGENVRAFCIELFVRALTMDLNELEAAKQRWDVSSPNSSEEMSGDSYQDETRASGSHYTEKKSCEEEAITANTPVQILEHRIAEKIAELAVLLRDRSPLAWRECLLTAFCLQPSSKRFSDLVEAAESENASGGGDTQGLGEYGRRGLEDDVGRALGEVVERGPAEDFGRGLGEDVRRGQAENFRGGLGEDVRRGLVKDFRGGLGEDLRGGLGEDFRGGLREDFRGGLGEDIGRTLREVIVRGQAEELGGGEAEDVGRGQAEDFGGLEEDVRLGLGKDFRGGSGEDVRPGLGEDIGRTLREVIVRGQAEELGGGQAEDVGRGQAEDFRGLGEDVGRALGEFVGRGLGEDVPQGLEDDRDDAANKHIWNFESGRDDVLQELTSPLELQELKEQKSTPKTQNLPDFLGPSGSSTKEQELQDQRNKQHPHRLQELVGIERLRGPQVLEGYQGFPEEEPIQDRLMDLREQLEKPGFHTSRNISEQEYIRRVQNHQGLVESQGLMEFPSMVETAGLTEPQGLMESQGLEETQGLMESQVLVEPQDLVESQVLVESQDLVESQGWVDIGDPRRMESQIIRTRSSDESENSEVSSRGGSPQEMRELQKSWRNASFNTEDGYSLLDDQEWWNPSTSSSNYSYIATTSESGESSHTDPQGNSSNSGESSGTTSSELTQDNSWKGSSSSAVSCGSSRVSVNVGSSIHSLTCDEERRDALMEPRGLRKSAEALGLTPALCDDLVVVLSCQRYRALSWSLDWNELQSRCLAYMHGEHSERTRKPKLCFLKPEYAFESRPATLPSTSDTFPDAANTASTATSTETPTATSTETSEMIDSKAARRPVGRPRRPKTAESNANDDRNEEDDTVELRPSLFDDVITSNEEKRTRQIRAKKNINIEPEEFFTDEDSDTTEPKKTKRRRTNKSWKCAQLASGSQDRKVLKLKLQRARSMKTPQKYKNKQHESSNTSLLVPPNFNAYVKLEDLSLTLCTSTNKVKHFNSNEEKEIMCDNEKSSQREDNDLKENSETKQNSTAGKSSSETLANSSDSNIIASNEQEKSSEEYLDFPTRYALKLPEMMANKTFDPSSGIKEFQAFRSSLSSGKFDMSGLSTPKTTLTAKRNSKKSSDVPTLNTSVKKGRSGDCFRDIPASSILKIPNVLKNEELKKHGIIHIMNICSKNYDESSALRNSKGGSKESSGARGIVTSRFTIKRLTEETFGLPGFPTASDMRKANLIEDNPSYVNHYLEIKGTFRDGPREYDNSFGFSVIPTVSALKKFTGKTDYKQSSSVTNVPALSASVTSKNSGQKNTEDLSDLPDFPTSNNLQKNKLTAKASPKKSSDCPDSSFNATVTSGRSVENNLEDLSVISDFGTPSTSKKTKLTTKKTSKKTSSLTNVSALSAKATNEHRRQKDSKDLSDLSDFPTSSNLKKVKLTAKRNSKKSSVFSDDSPLSAAVTSGQNTKSAPDFPNIPTSSTLNKTKLTAKKHSKTSSFTDVPDLNATAKSGQNGENNFEELSDFPEVHTLSAIKKTKLIAKNSKEFSDSIGVPALSATVNSEQNGGNISKETKMSALKKTKLSAKNSKDLPALTDTVTSGQSEENSEGLLEVARVHPLRTRVKADKDASHDVKCPKRNHSSPLVPTSPHYVNAASSATKATSAPILIAKITRRLKIETCPKISKISESATRENNDVNSGTVNNVEVPRTSEAQCSLQPLKSTSSMIWSAKSETIPAKIPVINVSNSVNTSRPQSTINQICNPEKKSTYITVVLSKPESSSSHVLKKTEIPFNTLNVCSPTISLNQRTVPKINSCLKNSGPWKDTHPNSSPTISLNQRTVPKINSCLKNSGPWKDTQPNSFLFNVNNMVKNKPKKNLGVMCEDAKKPPIVIPTIVPVNNVQYVSGATTRTLSGGKNLGNYHGSFDQTKANCREIPGIKQPTILELTLGNQNSQPSTSAFGNQPFQSMNSAAETNHGYKSTFTVSTSSSSMGINVGNNEFGLKSFLNRTEKPTENPNCFNKFAAARVSLDSQKNSFPTTSVSNPVSLTSLVNSGAKCVQLRTSPIMFPMNKSSILGTYVKKPLSQDSRKCGGKLHIPATKHFMNFDNNVYPPFFKPSVVTPHLEKANLNESSFKTHRIGNARSYDIIGSSIKSQTVFPAMQNSNTFGAATYTHPMGNKVFRSIIPSAEIDTYGRLLKKEQLTPQMSAATRTEKVIKVEAPEVCRLRNNQRSEKS